GGLQGNTHGGFIPTGETALFILAGDDLAARFEFMALFEENQVFARRGLLSLARPGSDEPALSGALTLSDECLCQFTVGTERKPGFNSDFPARRIETELDWDQLILPATTREQ